MGECVGIATLHTHVPADELASTLCIQCLQSACVGTHYTHVPADDVLSTQLTHVLAVVSSHVFAGQEHWSMRVDPVKMYACIQRSRER
jgi:hypothetical protein